MFVYTCRVIKGKVVKTKNNMAIETKFTRLSLEDETEETEETSEGPALNEDDEEETDDKEEAATEEEGEDSL